ncbi:MAG: carboxypeptidase-like regulatory domain-containing protein, partial [Rhodothermales bacterium]
MLLGTLLFGIGPVFAQDGQAERYTFDFRGMTLGEALQQLALTTGVGLVYDPALVGGLETACVARSQPVEAILRCLLKDTELDLKRLPAVAYVIRRREAAEQDAAPVMEQPLQYGSIRGVIFEEGTTIPLVGAHVIVAGLFTGAAAGQDGHFVIPRVPVGTYALEGSMIGFETAQLAPVVVRADQVTEITLALEEAPATLGEIIVTPGYFSMMHRRPAVHQTLTRTEIRDMPHLADDIYRTVTRLPGVSG